MAVATRTKDRQEWQSLPVASSFNAGHPNLRDKCRLAVGGAGFRWFLLVNALGAAGSSIGLVEILAGFRLRALGVITGPDG